MFCFQPCIQVDEMFLSITYCVKLRFTTERNSLQRHDIAGIPLYLDGSPLESLLNSGVTIGTAHYSILAASLKTLLKSLNNTSNKHNIFHFYRCFQRGFVCLRPFCRFNTCINKSVRTI